MKTSNSAEVRDFYDQTADHYAKMMDVEIQLPVYHEVLGRLHKQIEDLEGTLIDTSCGSGHMLEMYLNEFDARRSVLGLDLSPAMVAAAQKRLKERATVRVGDMRKLDNVSDGSAAGVLSFFALHHLAVEEIVDCLQEWHRVLSPGGVLVAGVWEGSGQIDYGDGATMIANRYQKEQIVEWSETAGFTILRCTVEPVEDFPMSAIYLDGKKGA